MKKSLFRHLAIVQAAALGLATTVHAEIPAAATTAITTAGTDILTAVGAVITAMVAVWGLMKLGRKMGWM